MQRNSNQDVDGTTWASAGLRLGEAGLDLRRPSEPPALSVLLNARFLDERTVERRDGHTGREIIDNSAWPVGDVTVAPETWIYGHGHVVGVPPGFAAITLGSGGGGVVAINPQNTHAPIHEHGAGVLRLGDEMAAWTGDRLIVPGDVLSRGQGSSTFWHRTGDGVTGELPWGIPAHLPLQVDTAAPAFVTGTWTEGCLTEHLRVLLRSDGAVITATVVDRATGLVVSDEDVSGASTSPVEPTALSSAGTPVILWRDSVDLQIYVRTWTGVEWTTANRIGTAVAAYDVAVVTDGFHLLWREGSTLRVGRYAGTTAQATPYQFGRALSVTSTPAGLVALAVTPTGRLGVAYGTSNKVHLGEYNEYGVKLDDGPVVFAVPAGGLSVVSRYLSGDSGLYEWVVHCATSSSVVHIVSSNHSQFTSGEESGGWNGEEVLRYNSQLASRSFRVGDEVFAWLRSTNAGTRYLLSGATHPYVSGYADREVGFAPDGGYWPSRVLADPADVRTEGGDFGVVRTWTRKFNTGDAAREGNVLQGTDDFLPQLTVAVHGKSAYLSGSAVKNWDGRVLADAGYQDFPTVTVFTQGTGGSLTALGAYEWRAYAVRYNDQGERFESAAVTTALQTLTGSNDKVTLTIATVPSISTDDSVIEVYRNEASGAAFYLEGTVANTLDAASVQFVSTMSDSTLIEQKADPHAVAVGQVAELESFGPIGSAILVSIGDRLWGAGGQVPLGQVQFSKLKTNGFGAGFDDLAGYLQVDNEHNGITSVAVLNDAKVIFERDRIYVLGGDGPDNFGAGAFSVPQLVLAAGATTHVGTALCQAGVLYWGTPGPLLLTQGFAVQNVSSPVRPLTETLTPTGVQVDVSRMEVVWYAGSTAVLMNYMSGTPRWARWDTARTVVAADNTIVTSDGRIWTESPDGDGDDGVPFAFTWRSGNVRAEQLLEGSSLMRRVGVAGQYNGAHDLRFREFYDGSPLWSEETTWLPETGTWLVSGDDLATLTPAQVDALSNADRSGAYATHKRLRRQTCHYVAVEVSDISSWTPTYTPFELSFEVGARPGLGRTPVNTFGRPGLTVGNSGPAGSSSGAPPGGSGHGGH